MSPAGFVGRYGPWALIAGASEGLGAEFAAQLAARGLNLLLLARRQGALDALAAQLRAQHPVEVRTLAVDLARPDLISALAPALAGLEVGLLVYNAAYSVIGDFLARPIDEHLRVVDVNCRGPLLLCHALGQPMAERGRGGIVLMTSMAGTQGSPLIASYGASKAFNLVLGEALWDELGQRGVDVIACRAGATRTPGYEKSSPRASGSPVMEAGPVVRQTLRALGQKPSLVPGGFNRFAAFLLGRLLPRRLAIRIMGNATRKMYRP